MVGVVPRGIPNIILFIMVRFGKTLTALESIAL